MTPPAEAFEILDTSSFAPVYISDMDGTTVAKVVEADIPDMEQDRNIVALGLVEIVDETKPVPTGEFALLQSRGGGHVVLEVVEGTAEVDESLEEAFIFSALKVAQEDLNAVRVSVRGEKENVRKRLLKRGGHLLTKDTVTIHVARSA